MRRARLAIFTALLVAPVTSFGSDFPFGALPAIIPVAMPEYWGAPDSLVLFVVALGIFGLLVRSKVLQVWSRRGK